MTAPRKTSREQAVTLLSLIIGGALCVSLAMLFPALSDLAGPGGMVLGTGLAAALFWFLSWRWPR